VPWLLLVAVPACSSPCSDVFFADAWVSVAVLAWWEVSCVWGALSVLCWASAACFVGAFSEESKMSVRSHRTTMAMAIPPMTRGVAYFLNPISLPLSPFFYHDGSISNEKDSAFVLLAFSEFSDVPHPDGDIGGVEMLD
jgi:hypothetical protein